MELLSEVGNLADEVHRALRVRAAMQAVGWVAPKPGKVGTPLFAERVLPFDRLCTEAYAELMATVRTAGLAIAAADGYIAAIAAANGLTAATCDTNPFEAAGATVINPWET